jgi:carboxyl-terminal processing protease
MVKYPLGCHMTKLGKNFWNITLGLSLSAAGLIWYTGSQPVLQAELTGPTQNDKYVSRVIAKYLTDEHLSKHAVDDEMSMRGFKNYLKAIDPLKLYFLESDINEFKANEKQLDDLLQKGDLRFAFDVYQRFLQRIDERVVVALKNLDVPHDFSVEEEFNTDGKKIEYAKSVEELDDRWRKRIKYDLLLQKADKVDPAEAKAKLTRRYNAFAKRMKQLNNDDLVEIYLTSITTSFDPHTTYMSASSIENFMQQMRLNLEGIGAALQYDDGYTKISKVMPGGPAEKDGRLKPEDRIVAVAQGDSTDFVDVVDMNLNDVVKLIRGKPNTKVQLKVLPGGKGETKIYQLTRAKIELKDSEARSEIIDAGKKPNGQPFKVGVINLPSFYMDMEGAQSGRDDYKSTTRDCKRLLDEFNAKGVDVVIMDLRKNGGGSLPEAINLTGLFIDTGPVVQIKDSDGTVEHKDDTDRGRTWNGPLVVLCSKASASASEIFAGAIQDYGRGLVIGDKTTHGKGTVQSLLDLSSRFFGAGNGPKFGSLKITINQFYRPNGDSTQNLGVVSDVEIPSITNHLFEGEADLDYALAFDKVPAVPIRKDNLIDPKLVNELKQLSSQRIAQSEEFQKEQKKIERFLKLKQDKKVNLNETKFMAERAELNTEKEEEKELEELNDPNAPVVKKDFYFNEAMNIALDFIRISNKLATK